ncbi:MAG: hypothetical protein A2029_10210 [Chloroflexi bacterium RBG_19FT_COMBO_47_9]|nr:MAG: hypothetical protein A2029_10210 [Chloroflexi bacterium RBG_19FT_COMBO_47_9]
MATQVFDLKFRNENVIENLKQLQKVFPYLTPEYAVESLLTLWTRHDYAMFKVMEKEFGTDKAVKLYSEIWDFRTRLEWGDIMKSIGKNAGDKLTIKELGDAMVASFAEYGNPMRVEEFTEDRLTLRCYDCPYTTQIMWKLLPPDEAMDYNKKIQLSCNHAIFNCFLELSGLADEWIFNFPSQLCMTNQYCEFTFVRKAFPKN